MVEVKYGHPCPSTAPDGAACAWSRSHNNDHRDAEMGGRLWTGGIRTAARWRCPRGYEHAPCGTCPTCMAGRVPECPVCGSTTPGSTPSCDCEAHRDAPSTETGEADPVLLLIVLGAVVVVLAAAGVLALIGGLRG